jgi:predicted O-methyltransferase YrrM
MRKERLKIAASKLLHQTALSRIGNRIEHVLGSPSLNDLYFSAMLMTDSAVKMASELLGEPVDYRDEFGGLSQAISASDTPSNYPGVFKIEQGTAYLLYAIVRHTCPALVVEVGVADGRSTQIILAAMDKNASGRLVSVDINDDVGGGAVGHPRWSLHVHHEATAGAELGALLTAVGAPDIFFHDAAHTYYSQYADYLAGWTSLKPGGVFLSDDVDQSWAFVDLARYAHLKPLVLIDHRKAVGALVRPEAAGMSN